MKKWFKKNKVILIAFAILTLLLLIYSFFQLNAITKHLPDLQIYVETGVISDSLYKVGISIGIYIIILSCWTILFTVIFLKMIFPTKQRLKDSFHYSEYEFLYNLPSRIRRELKK